MRTMWNPANKDLVDRFGPGKQAVPDEAAYGTYIARELMSIGFAPRQVYVTGRPEFVMTMPLLGGSVDALLICRVLRGTVGESDARVLASVRAVSKAVCCAVVTTGKLDERAMRYLAANRVHGIGQFFIGSDVSRLLDATGIVPEKLVRMASAASGRVSELERKLREARELLAYREQQAEAGRDKAGSDMFASGDAIETPRPEAKKPDGKAKFEAGKMDPLLPRAMMAVCGTNATSAGALTKRIGCDGAKAELLLSQMEEMGIVTAAKPGAPRFVKKTKAMMEKEFGLVSPEFMAKLRR